MTQSMAQKQKLFSIFFIAALAVIALFSLEAPRFLAYGPPLLGLVGIVAFTPFHSRRPELFKSAFVIVGSIVLLACLSAFWAIDPAEVWERTAKLAPLLLGGALFLSLCRAINSEPVEKYGWLISAGVMAAAALVAFELAADYPLYRLVRSINSAEFIPSNVFNRSAVSCTILLFPALAFIGMYRRHAKTLYILLIAAFAAMMLSIESQSAQLGLAIGLLTWIAFPYRFKAAWIVLAVFITVLIFTAPWLVSWLFEHFAANLNAIPFIGVGNGFAGARLEIWDYISRYLAQNPWTGFGIEATRSIKDFDSAEIYQKGTSILHPHNFAMQVWFEFGVIGAAAASAFCAYIIRAMHKNLNRKQQRIALPTFMVALSIASTSYGIWQGWWLGLLFLAAGCCILIIRSIEAEEPHAYK